MNGAAAVRAAESVGYENGGRLNFFSMKEWVLTHGNEYCVHVEHPVTEFTSGVDIVKEQIALLPGTLPFKQEDIVLRGHIECRITQKIQHLTSPKPRKSPTSTFQVEELDCGFCSLSRRHSPYYDSMISPKSLFMGRPF